MKIVQRIPNFVDIDGKPEEAEFSSVKELLSVPFVKRWSEIKEKGDRFVRFSIAKRSDLPKDKDTLMAEFEKSFWGVGLLTDSDSLDLPEWNDTRARINNW